MAEDQRQQQPKKRAKADAKAKGADAHKKSILLAENRNVAIKSLDVVGAIGLSAAGVLAFTSHRTLAVIFLFVALSSFVLAVYFTWLPKLRRAAKWKRNKINRTFIATETVVALLCIGLQIWVWTRPVKQTPIPTPIPHPAPVPTPIPELHGLLIPANDPRPQTWCESKSPDDVAVFLGNSVYYTDNKLTAVNIGGQEVIGFTKEEGDNIAVSARVISADNKVVAQITNNVFYVNPSNYFHMDRSEDWHTLVVKDGKGNQVLYVRYLNRSTVKVLGRFYVPGLPPYIIDEDKQIIMGEQMSRLCTQSGAGTGIRIGKD